MLKRIILLFSAAVLLLSFAACGTSSEETANVQSVAMITGTGSVGIPERFSGIVAVRGETKLNPDSSRKIKEILVKEGDEVEEGDVLFTYDMELSALDLEKAELELEQLKAGRDAKVRERDELQKQKEKAKQEEQLAYTLEIQACDTEIRSQEYNIALKEKDIEKLKETMEVSDFKSPLAGLIQKIDESAVQNGGGYPEDYYGGNQESAFITIVEAGEYRVKAYVNENNVGLVYEGMPVLIRSRVDKDALWNGEIVKIDWEAATQQQQSGGMPYMMESGAEMESTSKYPFYVELASAEGLLLGQHVYIEPDYGQSDINVNAMYLPEFYLFDLSDETGFVWARGANGKLEKREIALGDYNEDLMSYEVLSGLQASDYIAFPEEGLKEGMKCVEFDENAFEFEDGEGMEFMPSMEDGFGFEEEYDEGPEMEVFPEEEGMTE